MSQYIGARYVPKFMGTYDNTQAYENMVVVDNGLGTSYISKVPVPAGTPLTDTDYWALYGTSNGAIINLQNQIDAIVPKLTLVNVAEMIAKDLNAGDVVMTLGYVSAGDRGGAIYEISLISNAYSITLNNGLFANILSRGGVTPQMFGIVSGEPSSTAQDKWDLYIDYVNNTDMCYFLLPRGTYNVHKGFIIDKNMIGEDSHATIAADDTITDNFDDNKVTAHGIPYAINGLLAVGDVTSYIRLENISLNCNENCFYGLYIPEVNKSNFSNIRISQCNGDGIVCARVWMCKFDTINVFQAKRTAFNLGFPTLVIMPSGGIITSCDFSNLYVQGFGNGYNPSGYGYAFQNVAYSAFKALACDALEVATNCYIISACNSISFDDIGFEGCSTGTSDLIRITSGSAINFRNICALGCTMKSLIYIAGNCDTDVIGIYENNCTASYYFDIRNNVTAGSHNITIGNDVIGTVRNNAVSVSYILNTPTQLEKCVNNVPHNLLA